jgi:glycosyltransferase involved in cell wall biosynthesis
MPTYNNATTVVQLIESILENTSNLIVVNDGSTDQSLYLLQSIQKPFTLISYTENKGKGWALRQGFAKALAMGFRNAITIDSDGQHFTTDLALFLNKLEAIEKPCLILGNRNMNQSGIPAKSNFGNRFSNFWFWVETGQKQADTQTGYRLYPIKSFEKMRFYTRKFEFEIEVLTRSAWRSIPIDSVNVQVKYFQGSDRVSHFRPFKDFTRISLLNTVLVLWALLYIKPRDFILYFIKNDFRKIIKEQIEAHNESPEKISFTIGFGIFMGIIPIWGFQMLVAFFLAQWMKLNKTLVIIAANISLPPFIPFILLASYWTGGLLKGDSSVEGLFKSFEHLDSGHYRDFFNQMGYDFYQYATGAILLALVAGSVSMLLSLLILKVRKRIFKK